MITRRVNTKSRVFRWFTRLAPALLAGAITMTVFAPSSTAIVLPTAFVSLNGEGSWSVSQQLVPWQNELAGAKSFINLNYAGRGSFFGREDFLAGNADFAISGVPFSDAELKKVKGGASGLIEAPINVATLGTFVEAPAGGFRSITVRCDPDDPSTWPPDVTDGSVGCVVTAPVSGTIRIPTRNLAAMFFNLPAPPGTPSLTQWNNPAILKAMNVQVFAMGLNASASPGFAGRSDPDEISYYSQQMVETTQPDLWQENMQLRPAAQWEPISERIEADLPGHVTRDGAEQQVDQLAQGGSGVGLATSPAIQGGIAPAPPSTLRSFQSTFPGAAVTLAELQNANGDWVAPTPASINAAVDAGGDIPLYALTHKVANAYPLVWIDNFYAPAHGLSVEKTEGLAMLIRYLATTGQEKAGPVGEGRLPAPLVAKALQAADELVLSNCQGADRKVVVSSDPGPLAPATAKAMQSIGNMAHCERVGPPPATTTTTVAPTSTVPVQPQSPLPPTPGTDFTQSPGAVTPIATTGDTSGTGTTGSTAGTSSGPGATKTNGGTPLSGLLTASKLPLPAPGGASGSDRFATFLLGAALYLVGRKPVARLAHKVAS